MSSAAARWSRLVHRSHRSPLTVREFARREGVNPRTLAWYRWKLRGERGAARQAFAEVVVEPPRSAEAWAAGGLAVHIGTARVDIDGSTDLQLLRAVVEVLA